MPLPTDLVDIATWLMSTDSTSGRESAMMTAVADALAADDWEVTRIPVRGDRFDVLATAGKGPFVTLETHLDTVPPYIAPSRDDRRLFGRGSCDAKGIAAAMMTAADRLVSSGEQRVELLLVVGEEKGSDGARAANHLSATTRYLINGEPTESRLASGAKGSLRVTLRTHGREAHSAYAHLGKSAIEPMIELLPTIKQLPLPVDPVLGATTVNIGTIKGGTEANVIPALAEAELMFRLVGDVEPVKQAVAEWARGRAEIEWGSTIPAQRFHTVPGFETMAVAYTSDIPLLGRWGTPLLFGPGSIHVAHTPDEHIAVPELRESVNTYERLVRSLLAS